ncbi:ABC transporter ATP-binding protein [Flavobacteriaceae bacterium]|jgi:lipoprotein-releasing system ATP-binding protein|nr:ABC transporter ATP-binding protein [Flavobacteriaceae bacterium]
MNAKALINIKSLEKSYGQTPVLKGVDLQVYEREVVAIVGPSGAGKSTLLQIIGTLDKPSNPETCTIDILGFNTVKYADKQLAHFRNKHLGFIFQFHQLLPEFNAWENVSIPALIKGLSLNEAKDKAVQILSDLGLKDRLNHKPNQLSGGEQQRVSVARALINQPTLILADEPSGNLDTQNAQNLHELFFDIRDRWGTTIVVVTHNVTLSKMADRTISMEDGKMV